MAGIELATAYISIVPSTNRVAPEIRRALNQAQREASANPINVKVKADASEVHKLNRALAVVGKGVAGTSAVTGGLAAITGAAGLAAGAVGGLTVGLAALSGPALAGIGTVVVGMNGMIDTFKALSTARKSASADAKSQAKAVASAQKQVVSAQRSVAAAQDGVASALDGVVEANSRVSSALRGVEDAEKAVQRAKKDSRSAEMDLTRARKDATEQIEDLNLSLKGAALSEKDAQLSLLEARKDLQGLGTDGKPVDMLDRERAVLRVEQAEQRLAEVRESNQDLQQEADDANQKGVEGSDQVVAAKDRLVDANDRVVDAEQGVVDAHADVASAQKGVVTAEKAVIDAQNTLVQANQDLVDAQTAVTDAQNATSSSVDKAREAFEKLSPNAQDFVTSMEALRPAWEDLSRGVQDKLFDGIGTTFTDLANNIFPLLETGMGSVATSINGLTKNFADFFQTADAQAGLEDIFANTKTLIDGAAPGLQSLTQGFLDLGSAATPAMDGIASGISDMFAGVGDSLTALKDSGALTELFGNLGPVLGGVGALVGDALTALTTLANQVMPSLVPLFDAFGQALVDIAPSLGKLGALFADSLTAIMPTLADLINALADGLAPVMPVIAELLNAIGQAIIPVIPALSEMAQIVGTVLADTIKALAPALPPLADAFVAIMRAVEPLIPVLAQGFADILIAIAPALTTVANALAPVIAQLAQQLGPVIQEIAPVLGQVAAIIGQALADALTAIAPYLPQLVDSFSKLMIALLPMLPKLAELGMSLLPILTDALVFVLPYVTKLIDGFTWLVEKVMPYVISWMQGLIDKWKDTGEALRKVYDDVIKPMVDRFMEALGKLGDFFKWVWQEVIKPAWDELGAGIKWVIDNVISPAWEGLKNGLQGVGDFFGKVVDTIQATWDRVKDIVRKPIEFLVNAIYNKGIVPAWNSVAGFIGLDDKKLKPIEGFATGGVYPGYTPGRDTGVIAVGGGEAIMRPEWTRAVGSDYVNAGNAAARQGGVSGVRKFLGAFADGGIVDSMAAIVKKHFPALTLTSGQRNTADYHGQGMAADFSNAGNEGSPEMQGLANYIAEKFPNSLELIHSPFDRNIKNGNFVGDGMGYYGADTMAQHRNHVHWAVDSPVVDDGKGGGLLGKIGGLFSSGVGWLRNKVADVFEKPIRALGNTIPEFPGDWGKVPRGIYDKLANSAIDFVRGRSGSNAKPGEPGGGAEQWRGMAMEALARTGFTPPENYIENMLRQIMSESGGNPSIVQQVQDVNSGGNEGVGLLQIIPGTFASYRDPSLPDDRTDPMANMVAALRYVRDRYGDPNSVWGQGHGYDQGGMFANNTFGWNTSGKPEAVLTNAQWKLFDKFVDQLASGRIVEAIEALRTPAPAEVNVSIEAAQVAPEAATMTQPTAADFAQRATSAGSSFLQANIDENLGFLGFRSSGGAIQELVKQIQDATVRQISEEMRKSRTAASAFVGRR